jgi:hypothetical protein
VKTRIGIALATFLAGALSVSAHHSFVAEYDVNQIFAIEGTVTRLDWTNPHSRIYLDVKDRKGVVSKWSFELGGPLTLTRLGWTRDSVKPGDRVKVQGYRSKDGSMTGNGRTITFPDGHILRSRNGEAKPAKQ